MFCVALLGVETLCPSKRTQEVLLTIQEVGLFPLAVIPCSSKFFIDTMRLRAQPEVQIANTS